jgi:hypothetical protein
MLPLRSPVAFAILACLGGFGWANPIPLPNPVETEFYMAGEDVTMTVGPKASEVRGHFSFRLATRGETKKTYIGLPVLVPMERAKQIAASSRRRLGSEQEDYVRSELLKLIKPEISLGGRKLPEEAIFARLVGNDRPLSFWQKIFGRPEVVYQSVVVDRRYDIALVVFMIPARTLMRSGRVDISYRQFHAPATSRELPDARYIPMFENMPAKLNPPASPAYQIRVVSGPGVHLEMTSRNVVCAQKNSTYTIAPRHGEAISFRVQSTLPSARR